MHIGFPFRLDGRGRTGTVDDDAYARGLIEQVLFTSPGERVNRPDFGSGLHRLVFEPVQEEIAVAATALLQAELQRWLADEVEIAAVDVAARDGTLRVTVVYRTPAASSVRTAVFTREL